MFLIVSQFSIIYKSTYEDCSCPSDSLWPCDGWSICSHFQGPLRLHHRRPSRHSPYLGLLRFALYKWYHSGPDSKESYGIMRNVMKTVDFAAKGIKFTYQHIPLSYHFYAFKVHQGNQLPIQPSSMYRKQPQLTLPKNLLTISSIIKNNSSKAL